MFPPIREELRGLEPYGAPQLDVPVQLNTNENPYGPSEACVADIAASVAEAARGLHRYPDREHFALRTALADYLARDTPHGIAVEQVWAANPLAVKAGVDILAKGGTATDAAIAVQMVLNLVEPQSSGIGGGAFMLHYDKGANKLLAYDGRETAPKAATPNLFIGADGKPLAFLAAVDGGLSVGTPGVLRMLEAAHKAHGKLPWKDLFEPAIKLSEDGFAISQRMSVSIAGSAARIKAQGEPGSSYFLNADGTAKAAGTLLLPRAFRAGGACELRLRCCRDRDEVPTPARGFHCESQRDWHGAQAAAAGKTRARSALRAARQSGRCACLDPR